jgi:hypothetical protein
VKFIEKISVNNTQINTAHSHTNLISTELITSTCYSAVGIATGYGLDDRGVAVRVPGGSRIFTSQSHPDRVWGPSNLLFNEYRGAFPGGKAAGA